MIIVFDGRMTKPRKKIINIVSEYGYQVYSKVNQKTKFLVCSNSSKRITKNLLEAILNRVEIITENQLYNILENK